VADATAVDRNALDLFERSLRGLLTTDGVDVDAALAEVGWRDFLAADPVAAVPLLFGVQGELLLGGTALDDVALDALDFDPSRLEIDGALVHPRRCVDAAMRHDRTLVVDGLVVGERTPASFVVVVGSGAVIVPATALDCAVVQGIDPSLELVRVRGTVSLADVSMADDVDGAAVAPACRRALAYELLGAVDAMLATATEYAQARHQFGQPIGAFQAVKHRLADVYVARQAASAVLAESWHSEPECTTLAAKALAARAGALAAEHCLQVLGAIGFALEHPLHRFVRRVRVLDHLYGTEAELRTQLGRLLLARGRVPRPGSA